jgi:hypothetical protein
MKIILEFLEYFIKNKKWFMIPLILSLLVFGTLLLITSGSSTLTPFIYAIF